MSRRLPLAGLFALLLAAAAASPVAAESPAAPVPQRADPFTAPIVPIPDPEPKAAPEAERQTLPVLRMAVGEMEVVRLADRASTLLSTFPGIVTLGTEGDTLLFIFAERPGETQVLIADSNYQELFASTIIVEEPGAGQN